jgi:hypothetical protein
MTLGSGGDVTKLFTEPGYRRAVVPAALAASGGTGQANRVVPDISANVGAAWKRRIVGGQLVPRISLRSADKTRVAPYTRFTGPRGSG